MKSLKIKENIIDEYKKQHEKLETYIYIEDELFYKPQKNIPKFFNKEIYSNFMKEYLDGDTALKWKQNEINKEIQSSFDILFSMTENIITDFKENIEYTNINNIKPKEWVKQWFDKTLEIGCFEDNNILSSILINNIKDDLFEEAIEASGKDIRSITKDILKGLPASDTEPTENLKNKLKEYIISDPENSFLYLNNVYSKYGNDNITNDIFNGEVFNKVIENNKNDISKIIKDGFNKDIQKLKDNNLYNIFNIKNKSLGINKYLTYLQKNNKHDFEHFRLNITREKEVDIVLNNIFKKNKKNNP